MPRKDTQFKPGQSGNPKGRPKGSFSLKTRVIKYLESNPDKLEITIESLATDPKHRELLFKMIDGTPKQQVEAHICPTPIPIMGGLSMNKNNSKKE
jgi:hypothetical protein